MISKLVPEVCHAHQFGIATSFLSAVCPDHYYKSAVRCAQVMLVSDIQTPRKGQRNVGLLFEILTSLIRKKHQKPKNQNFVRAHELNTCCDYNTTTSISA